MSYADDLMKAMGVSSDLATFIDMVQDTMGSTRATIDYKKWIEVDGSTITVVDMDIPYIASTIHMLLRNNRFNSKQWIDVFIQELINRDEKKLAAKFILLR